MVVCYDSPRKFSHVGYCASVAMYLCRERKLVTGAVVFNKRTHGLLVQEWGNTYSDLPFHHFLISCQ